MSHGNNTGKRLGSNFTIITAAAGPQIRRLRPLGNTLVYGLYIFSSFFSLLRHLRRRHPPSPPIIFATQQPQRVKSLYSYDSHRPLNSYSGCSLGEIAQAAAKAAAGASSPELVPVLCPLPCRIMFSTNNSPALYDDRTMGPLATYRKPSSLPLSAYSSNFAGVTYSSTAKWCSVGRRYCPNVSTSTPAARRSRIVCQAPWSRALLVGDRR